MQGRGLYAEAKSQNLIADRLTVDQSLAVGDDYHHSIAEPRYMDHRKLSAETKNRNLVVDIDLSVGRSLAVVVGCRLLIPALLEDRSSRRLSPDAQSQSLFVAVECLIH